MAEPGYLTIGEVAEAAGVSTQTLRVWEAKELLIPERSDGGHRRYTQDHLDRALTIVRLRQQHGWNPAAIRTALGRTAATTPPQWHGPTLRAVRKDRGMSIKEAAQRIGVSSSFLSSVERGEAAVTTQFAARVADAYLLPMTALADHHAKDSHIVRNDERARGEFAGGVLWEELVLPGHAFEAALLTVPPGENSGGSYARPGETLVLVTEGELTVSRGDEDLVVGTGDALSMPGGSEFAWENRGTAAMKAVWIEQLPAGAWDEQEVSSTVTMLARRRH
ncbi:MerR family transcriptional regulator [Amycolatopsis jejuensis]|uniref:MerR family transcriptional regulator n=1 Tax=Amycolatopsis jejuensis TaxID=330084 RepID=UPI00052720A0|nr:MerR family transcriptional regulator [Amycolatopsis jejuensis]